MENDVIVWSTQSLAALHKLRGHGAPVTGLAVHGSLLATYVEDSVALKTAAFQSHHNSATPLFFSIERSCSQDQMVNIWPSAESPHSTNRVLAVSIFRNLFLKTAAARRHRR